MAIIEDIKCPRCDRKYSGVRSRCPYCGARRLGFGKYSKDTDNAKGKMLISVLILAVFAVAAGIMLFTTPEPIEEVIDEPIETPSLEDILSLPGFDDTPEPTPFEPDTPPPPPQVERIAVLYGGNPLAFYPHFTQKLSAGTDQSFSVAVEPPGLDVEVEIISDDESIFTVEPVVGGRANGFSVTGVSTGNAKLIVTCGDLVETIFVTIS